MDTLRNRFLDKVFEAGPMDCWEWIGAIDHETGYGRIGRGGRKDGTVGAHRVAFELEFGPIPEGKEVCHHCDNRWCVNPYHLFAGTRSDNMRDASRKGRIVNQTGPCHAHF